MARQFVDKYTRKFEAMKKSQDDIRAAQMELQSMLKEDVGSDPVMMDLLARALSSGKDVDVSSVTTGEETTYAIHIRHTYVKEAEKDEQIQ